MPLCQAVSLNLDLSQMQILPGGHVSFTRVRACYLDFNDFECHLVCVCAKLHCFVPCRRVCDSLVIGVWCQRRLVDPAFLISRKAFLILEYSSQRCIKTFMCVSLWRKKNAQVIIVVCVISRTTVIYCIGSLSAHPPLFNFHS